MKIKWNDKLVKCFCAVRKCERESKKQTNSFYEREREREKERERERKT